MTNKLFIVSPSNSTAAFEQWSVKVQPVEKEDEWNYWLLNPDYKRNPRIRKAFCNGHWSSHPNEGYYFTDEVEACKWAGYLTSNAYLDIYVSQLSSLALSGNPQDITFNAKELFPAILRYSREVEAHGTYLKTTGNTPLTPTVLRKCLRVLGLDKELSPELFTDSISIPTADLELLDKLSGVTKETGPRAKVVLRQNYIHQLLVKGVI